MGQQTGGQEKQRGEQFAKRRAWGGGHLAVGDQEKGRREQRNEESRDRGPKLLARIRNQDPQGKKYKRTKKQAEKHARAKRKQVEGGGAGLRRPPDARRNRARLASAKVKQKHRTQERKQRSGGRRVQRRHPKGRSTRSLESRGGATIRSKGRA